MSRPRDIAFVLAITVSFTGSDGVGPRTTRGAAPESAETTSHIRFEPNLGQFDPAVRYLGRAGGLSVALSSDAMELGFGGPGGCKDAVALRVENASPVNPEASESLPTKSHYFLGSDPAQWHANVPSFATVRYPGIRPGVDLVCHGGRAEGGAFEYDLVIAPEARIDDLVVDVEGGGPLTILADGALSIPTPRGDVIQRLPFAYQSTEDGQREPIPAHYRLLGPGSVGFEIARFDRRRPLVIDPVLTYSTLLGGASADSAQGIAIDSGGNVYVTGASPAGFPTSSTAFQRKCSGDLDAFVAKLAPDGQSVLFATYLGGSGDDIGASLAIDSSGNVYIAGQTQSANFPIANAVEPSPSGVQAGFVAMLDASGSTLIYSTYLGGSGTDTATGVAVDSSGNACVTGQTQSATFPLANALQPLIAGGTDAFITKFGPGGTTLVYSTYLGGLHNDGGGGIALDADGNAYVTGATYSLDFPEAGPIPSSGSGGAFLSELDPSGGALVYSVSLGASFDLGQAVAVDSAGNAYMAGLTTSGSYPVMNPLPGSTSLTGTNAFVTKIASSGAAIEYSTLLGGSNFSSATGIAVDGAGEAFVTGYTYATNFPTTAPIQVNPITEVNGIAAFVSEIEPDDSAFVFSTYLGGSGSTYGYAIAVSPTGNAYVAGATGDLNFPTQNAFEPAFPTSGAGSQAFVSELAPGDRPLLAVTPSPAMVAPLGSTTFHASGGSGGGYVFSLFSNESGGSIGPVSGVYAAGSRGGVLDVVLVEDSSGTSAAASVLVSPMKPSDGGLEAGEGGVIDSGASDSRSDDAGSSGREGGARDASSQDSRVPELTQFNAEGSECSYRGSQTAGEPFAAAITALVATLIGLARRRQRRNPL
jgi:Beta-propeller repeat